MYRLNDTQALVATTDFFTPIVDDPYDFGRIAAANALSDVYAMGGRPIMALALLGVPLGKLSTEVVQRIVAGGHAVCEAAGVPIAGGHSVDTPGRCRSGRARPGGSAQGVAQRPGAGGDVLILGKGWGRHLGPRSRGRAARQVQQMVESTRLQESAGGNAACMP